MQSFTFLVITFLLLTGCTETVQPVSQEAQRPSWIGNPYQNGVVGAIGTAHIHFRGDAEQRKLAISRALDELAQQQNTVVSSQIVRKESRNGMMTSSNAEIYSFQKSSGETVRAHIEAVWKDPRNGELFVWMIKD